MSYPWSANDVLTAADLNAAIVSGPSATVWNSYTPTLTQTATVTKTVSRATWTRDGTTISGQFSLSVTGAGTAGASVRVGLPSGEEPVANTTIGFGYIFDTSTSTRYIVAAVWLGSNIGFVHDTSGASTFGTAPAVTLASGDLIDIVFGYETAP